MNLRDAARFWPNDFALHDFACLRLAGWQKHGGKMHFRANNLHAQVHWQRSGGRLGAPGAGELLADWAAENLRRKFLVKFCLQSPPASLSPLANHFSPPPP
jgi:hypothetical protein